MPQHQQRVSGPMGRTFNRILKVPDGRTDTGDMAFSRDQLRAYLDSQLQLAEDEWFRGTKLDGVADALMERLDTNGDGAVGWEEFEAFRADILKAIAPGVEVGAPEAEVESAATGSFDQVDKDRSGSLSMGEVEGDARAALPEDTEHRDLIAQLGARLTMDAVDSDERGKKVAARRLSRTEWVGSAKELARKP